jgi:thiol:disulfide interchange protein DsbD
VNCAYNERSVFSKPEFQELFKTYKLVQLYTDQIPDRYYAPALRDKFGGDTRRQDTDGAANADFQKAAFGDAKLPLYVILEPQADGKVKIVDVYDEGKINDEKAFSEFLKRPNDPVGSELHAEAGH